MQARLTARAILQQVIQSVYQLCGGEIEGIYGVSEARSQVEESAPGKKKNALLFAQVDSLHVRKYGLSVRS